MNKQILGSKKEPTKLEREFWSRFGMLLFDDPEDPLNEIICSLRRLAESYWKMKNDLLPKLFIADDLENDRVINPELLKAYSDSMEEIIAKLKKDPNVKIATASTPKRKGKYKITEKGRKYLRSLKDKNIAEQNSIATSTLPPRFVRHISDRIKDKLRKK